MIGVRFDGERLILEGLPAVATHAYGAAFDNPDLLVACVVGDGEAETGPLATSWHSNKFLNAANMLVPTGDPGNNSVVAGDYTGSTYQQWNLQHIGGGQYQITCAANGWADFRNSSTADSFPGLACNMANKANFSIHPPVCLLHQ